VKRILFLALAATLATTEFASAHVAGGGMMGYGAYPGMMNPGMMMGPGMMGGNMMGMMNPGMMGYGSCPNMMNPGMMMGPGMMGGNMMGMMSPGMMVHGAYPYMTAPSGDAARKFLDETAELRGKLNTLVFEYAEAVRDPDADPAKVEALGTQIRDLQEKISEKWQAATP